jgi:hypothetical protein
VWRVRCFRVASRDCVRGVRISVPPPPPPRTALASTPQTGLRVVSQTSLEIVTLLLERGAGRNQQTLVGTMCRSLTASLIFVLFFVVRCVHLSCCRRFVLHSGPGPVDSMQWQGGHRAGAVEARREPKGRDGTCLRDTVFRCVGRPCPGSVFGVGIKCFAQPRSLHTHNTLNTHTRPSSSPPPPSAAIGNGVPLDVVAVGALFRKLPLQRYQGVTSPLIQACAAKNAPVVEVLLRAGVDPSKPIVRSLASHHWRDLPYPSLPPRCNAAPPPSPASPQCAPLDPAL